MSRYLEVFRLFSLIRGLSASVDLARRVRRNLAGIPNAIVESTNTKLRVLTRMAFGFRQPEHTSPTAGRTPV